MKKPNTTGLCAYCDTEIPGNSRSIIKHLSICEGGIPTTKKKPVPYMILLIQAKCNPEYWLVIKARTGITMKKLDQFLRDIWVECCDHLSSFSDSNYKIGMSRKISEVFENGNKIDYVYDFGTPTELSLSLLKTIQECNESDIQVIIRNQELDYECSSCGESATELCLYCSEEEEFYLCDICLEDHKCVLEAGEEVLLPLHNSPRSGVCGYYGYLDGDVKKYFPKEVF